mgnify:CR=1 FL=1
MKQRRNRVAYYKNDCEFGWLRNATKKEFSSAHFAYVYDDGDPDYRYASNSRGVRPEFWLVRYIAGPCAPFIFMEDRLKCRNLI